MRSRFGLLMAGVALVGGLAASAEACHQCGRTPCAMPAYRPVTEMVPYTVMKSRVRTEWVEQTVTVMAKEPVTTMIPKTIVVRRPEYDTTYVTRSRVVCRPEFDTTYVTKYVPVCRPVPTERQVTAYCMKPTSWVEPTTVTCGGGCGLGAGCGGHHGGHATTAYVTKTCLTPVPVTRTVVDIHMVREIVPKEVPVMTCRMVREVVTEEIPIRHCRMVTEVKTIEVPHTRIVCAPKQITKMVPVRVPEVVPVTCYRPVTRMVPCGPVAAPAPYAQALYAPASAQIGAPAPQH